jgi:hypothetical protein
MFELRWIVRLLPVIALAFAPPALADGMRCGQRLVSSGDSLYEVRSRCGEPDAAERRTEQRRVERRVHVPCEGARRCVRTDSVTVDVVIDEWVYDLGRQRFIRYLTFEDGKLRVVTTGSYGNES